MIPIVRNQTKQLSPDACEALYKILDFDRGNASYKPLNSVDTLKFTFPKVLISSIMQRFLLKVREVGGQAEYKHLYHLLITSKHAKQVKPRFNLFMSVILITFAPTDWQVGLLDLVQPSKIAHEVFDYVQRYGVNNQIQNLDYTLKQLNKDMDINFARQQVLFERSQQQLINTISGYGEAQLMMALANNQDLLRLFEMLRGNGDAPLSQHVSADKKHGYNVSDLNGSNAAQALKDVLDDQTYRKLRTLADIMYEDTRKRHIKRKRKIFIENDKQKGSEKA